MLRLVYLSPVPWESFAQRPHKFVDWFHHRTGKDVLWIEPYPTRLPRLDDLLDLRKSSKEEVHVVTPPWLKVINPGGLPIEPIPGSKFINRKYWHEAATLIDDFAGEGGALVVVGKPSELALLLLRRLKGCHMLYDAMDDFPAFYSGMSRLSMQRREMRLAKFVHTVWASSTELQKRWSSMRDNVHLVANGLDIDLLPPLRQKVRRQQLVFGYVGTIANWFDWEWICAFAQARPLDEVRLIGPVLNRPSKIPQNIKMLPACDHRTALRLMADFDVGLIPFKSTKLTASVDPIKYYEYRALNIPIISTSFGEMRFRSKKEGVFIAQQGDDLEKLAGEAAAYSGEANLARKFAQLNSWWSRFDDSELLPIQQQ